MRASYNELLEEKGTKQEEVPKKSENVNFSKPIVEEPPVKIDFFGTENNEQKP